MIGTATFVPTLKVTRVALGSRFMALPSGTTDVNASDVVAPYVRKACWTWAFAGSKDNATMVIVTVRKGDWAGAERRLHSLCKKHGGLV